MKYRRNLPLLLLKVRELVRSHFQPTFREYGITEQQWRILRLLDEHPNQSVVEIADECSIMRPSIVGIIARMVEMNLLVREPCKKDRRRAIVNITPEGQKMVEEILPIFEEIYRDIANFVGKEKLDQVFVLLDDFSNRMHQFAARDKLS